MISGFDSLYKVRIATVNGQQLIVIGGQDWDFVTDWLETLEGIEVKRMALAQIEKRFKDQPPSEVPLDK